MKKYWPLKIVGAVLVGAAFMFLYIFVFKSLWNWIVPAVFQGPQITFLHALGLILLAKMLFGGFHGKGGGCNGWKNRKKHFWKSKFREKCQNMTEEEREALKNKFKAKFERCWKDDVPNKAPIILLAVTML